MNTACVDLFSVWGGFGEIQAQPRRYQRRTGTEAAASVTNNIFARVSAERLLLSKINELASQTSVPGWDGERGEALLSRQWDEVRQLVSRYSLELVDIPSPFISACGDGSAHLQWTTTRGDRGVIEIGVRSTTWSFVPMADDGEDLVVELSTPYEGLAKVRSLFGRT